MAAGYLLALDQGTSSSRAALVDPEGSLVGLAAETFPTLYPADGWVEQDPEALWRSQLSAARRVLADARVSVDQVAAVGLTNQRETTLLWQRSDGAPLYPAIVWQDRRTADRCLALGHSGAAKVIRARTGLVSDPYFSATKLEWLLETVDGARAAAERGSWPSARSTPTSSGG